jgi:hypothetical protein
MGQSLALVSTLGAVLNANPMEGAPACKGFRALGCRGHRTTGKGDEPVTLARLELALAPGCLLAWRRVTCREPEIAGGRTPMWCGGRDGMQRAATGRSGRAARGLSV